MADSKTDGLRPMLPSLRGAGSGPEEGVAQGASAEAVDAAVSSASAESTFVASSAGSGQTPELEALLNAFHTRNGALEMKVVERHRSFVVRCPNQWVYFLPFPRSADGSIHQAREFTSSVLELTGKSTATLDEVLAALSQKHGVVIPGEGWVEGMRLQLTAIERELSGYVPRKLGELRDALNPMVERGVAQLRALRDSEVAEAVERVRGGSRVLVQRYGRPIEDALGVRTQGSAYQVYSTTQEGRRLSEQFDALIEHNAKEHGARAPFRNERSGTFGHSFTEYVQSLPAEEAVGIWAWVKDQPVHIQLLCSAISPVGEYGTAFAEALHVTTLVVLEALLSRLSETSAEVFFRHAALLTEKTARGADSAELGPLFSLVESVVSLQQAFSQLLADKVPGHPDPLIAMKALVAPTSVQDPNGALNRYVQKLRMGVVGPLTMGGRHAREPVVASEDGQRLRLSEELDEALSRIDRVVEESERFIELTSRKHYGRCPFAIAGQRGEKTGVQQLAEAYVEVFERVSAVRARG